MTCGDNEQCPKLEFQRKTGAEQTWASKNIEARSDIPWRSEHRPLTGHTRRVLFVEIEKN